VSLLFVLREIRVRVLFAFEWLNKLTTLEIAWLAGYLEGEGWFGAKVNSPKIRVQATDLDVIQHAARLLDVPVTRVVDERENRKDCYALIIQGQRAAEWMMTLYTLMGERRKAKIRVILFNFRSFQKRGPNISTRYSNEVRTQSKRRSSEESEVAILEDMFDRKFPR
jgi:hypothetical protein